MSRTSAYTLVLLLVVIATITELTSRTQKELCNSELPLSIFGVEIGEAKSDLESSWTLSREQNSFYVGYARYHRFEASIKRDVVIDILLNEDDEVASIIGNQLERGNTILASTYMTIDEARKNMLITTWGTGSRRATFLGGYLEHLPLDFRETTGCKSLIAEVCIGSEPAPEVEFWKVPGTVNPRNDHGCDNLPQCGPHVLQR